MQVYDKVVYSLSFYFLQQVKQTFSGFYGVKH